MKLIVDDLPLCLLALDRSKLATADRVPNSDGSSFHDKSGASKDNSDACLHHDLIDYLRIALHFKVTFGRDASEARQQVCPGDSEMIELQVAIVHGEVPELHTDVADLDSGKRLVCLLISDRHEEGQNAIVALIDDAACKHYSMISLHSKVSWPELGCFKRRCMDFPLLRLQVEGGRSLKTCHI